jgi:hypothetical protein
MPTIRGFRVKITLKDGRSFNHVTPCEGSHAQSNDLGRSSEKLHAAPLSRQPLPHEKLDRLISLCREMEKVPDMRFSL